MTDWNVTRGRLLRRFYRTSVNTEAGSVVRCACGESYAWSDLGGDPLCAWVDVHGPHMPPLPSEPLLKPDAQRALRAILDRIAVEEADPHNDYGDVGECIDTIQKLAREGLGEETNEEGDE